MTPNPTLSWTWKTVKHVANRIWFVCAILKPMETKQTFTGQGLIYWYTMIRPTSHFRQQYKNSRVSLHARRLEWQTPTYIVQQDMKQTTMQLSNALHGFQQVITKSTIINLAPRSNQPPKIKHLTTKKYRTPRAAFEGLQFVMQPIRYIPRHTNLDGVLRAMRGSPWKHHRISYK